MLFLQTRQIQNGRNIDYAMGIFCLRDQVQLSERHIFIVPVMNFVFLLDI